MVRSRVAFEVSGAGPEAGRVVPGIAEHDVTGTAQQGPDSSRLVVMVNHQRHDPVALLESAALRLAADGAQTSLSCVHGLIVLNRQAVLTQVVPPLIPR